MDKKGMNLSRGQLLLAIAGLFVSLGGLAWLLLLPEKPHDFLPRWGWAFAVLSVEVMLVICWGTLAAYVARARNWLPRTCFWLGALSFIVPGLAIFFMVRGPLMYAGTSLITVSSLAGYVCRKLAYPELTDEEAMAPPPPPSIFSK
jgi:hypothetical protein